MKVDREGVVGLHMVDSIPLAFEVGSNAENRLLLPQCEVLVETCAVKHIRCT